MNNTLRLTRGVELAWDVATSRLICPQGRTATMDFARVPLKLWITLEGDNDPRTGMLVNVSEIKRAIAQVLTDQGIAAPDAPSALRQMWQPCTQKFSNHKLFRLVMELGDSLKIAISRPEDDMIEVTTKYEIAASHCLSRPEWDQQKNFDVFGKCSNPAGHGHNYLVEITLRATIDALTGRLIDQGTVDRIVQERIIDRFDHKDLNTDTAEFAQLVPTVENMAKVFWELLVGRFDDADLARVAVWETPKTFAEYFGPAVGPLRYTDTV